jgi:hypothetical protein
MGIALRLELCSLSNVTQVAAKGDVAGRANAVEDYPLKKSSIEIQPLLFLRITN